MIHKVLHHDRGGKVEENTMDINKASFTKQLGKLMTKRKCKGLMFPQSNGINYYKMIVV